MAGLVDPLRPSILWMFPTEPNSWSQPESGTNSKTAFRGECHRMEAGPRRLRLCSPGLCGGSRADAIGRRPPVRHPRCCQSRDAHGRGSTGQDQITRTISPPLITPLLGWKNSLKSSVRREVERTVCPVASAARLLAWRHDRAAGSGNRLPEPLQTACTTPSPPGRRGTSSGPGPAAMCRETRINDG